MKQLKKLLPLPKLWQSGKSILTDIFFYLSILFFIIGFNFTDNMAGGWYQQFMPNLGGRQIQDITFLDSLTGYASARQTSDTSYILKTTNGGDNWQIIYRNFFAMTQIQFLNVNTGYTVGAYLYKTTNGGFNWSQVTAPAISPEELYVLNEDSIWIISSNSLTGGVYRTTNGGANWDQQINLGSYNPNHIYMFNNRIGFIGGNTQLHKTTTGGENWYLINGTGVGSFSDICFVDSLTGWKSKDAGGGGWLMGKTTDGGLNWVEEILPSGGYISNGSGIVKLSVINKDTIWGAGGFLFYPGQGQRAFLYRTTNGGNNWLLQIPDTSFHIPALYFIQFINNKIGWVYGYNSIGVHTTTGGNDTFYTGLKNITSNFPEQFKLYQNFPNPFNPKTIIRYDVRSTKSEVKLIVYDITGKEITTLVNEVKNSGTYEVVFSGNGFSSGVYFYSFVINNKLIDTKRMLLIK
jgi:photosystem II stability/assembly factor-like uncharacterized protein